MASDRRFPGGWAPRPGTEPAGRPHRTSPGSAAPQGRRSLPRRVKSRTGPPPPECLPGWRSGSATGTWLEHKPAARCSGTDGPLSRPLDGHHVRLRDIIAPRAARSHGPTAYFPLEDLGAATSAKRTRPLPDRKGNSDERPHASLGHCRQGRTATNDNVQLP